MHFFRYGSRLVLILLLIEQMSIAPALAANLELTGIGSLAATYSYATGVSADGSVIVGGSSDGANEKAFVWTLDNGMQDIGTLGVMSWATGVSADGTIVSGISNNGFVNRATRWTQGTGMVSLGVMAGGTYSNTSGISGDGSTIFGFGDTGAHNGVDQPFVWTSGGGMVHMGSLGAANFYGVPYDSSYDGSVIVGLSRDNANNVQAFKWTLADGMINLGDLGGNDSRAYAVSRDGSVITGVSDNGVSQEAFIWTQSDGMVGLGSLSGTNHSYGTLISDDGTVIAGYAFNASNVAEVFRWTQETGMVGIGAENANDISEYTMNADGSVIAGVLGIIGKFFRWTTTDGYHTLEDLLTTAGVDYTGWDLSDTLNFRGTYLSADGSKIIGTGSYLGSEQVFIFTDKGLATPQGLAKSLIPATEAARQTINGLSGMMKQSLFAARQAVQSYSKQQRQAYGEMPIEAAAGTGDYSQINTAAGGYDWKTHTTHPWSFYSFGSLGAGQNNDFDNLEGTGTLGVFYHPTDDLAIGAGIIGDGSRVTLDYEGQDHVTLSGAALNAAYETPDGLRLYGTAAAAYVDVNMDRNYLNGSGIDGSKGKTHGIAYGAAARAGWSFPIDETKQVMPYVEAQASHMQLDSYAEIGGAFPAIIDKQGADFSSAYVGAEATYDINPEVQMRMRAAWGHQIQGDGTALTGTIIGFNETVPFIEGDKDWAEGGVTMMWSISDKTNLYADMSGRSGNTSEPAASITAGITVQF